MDHEQNHSASLGKYDVVVEKNNGSGYTARVLSWPACVVEASTREDVLKTIRATIVEQLAKADIVTIDVSAEKAPNPLLKYYGDWAGDPGIAEFREEVERFRREVDEEWAARDLEDEAISA